MSTDCCKSLSVSANGSTLLLFILASELVSSISLFVAISRSATLFSKARSLVSSMGPKLSKAGLKSTGSEVKFCIGGLNSGAPLDENAWF